MKIAIEMPFDAHGKRGWIYYVESLLRAFARVAPSDEFIVFAHFFRRHAERVRSVFCPDAPNFHKLVPRWPQSVVSRLERELGLPLVECYLKLRGARIFHAAYVRNAALLPTILTVHDNMYLRHPERMTDSMRRGWEREVRPGLSHVRLFIAHSEHHKRETVELLGVDPGRIRVVLPGANTDLFRPMEECGALDEVRRRLRLLGRFFVMVGPFSRWWCRYDTVVEALARLKDSHPDLALALVGDPSPEDDRLKVRAESLGVGSRLLWLGRLAAQDLNVVFNLALANIYPAWDTGCSFNVLDSMAAGLPVVTAPVSLLPEMLGDSGVWADPYSPEEIERAMRRLAEDAGYRDRMAALALARAQARRWEDTARSTLEVYREAAGSLV